MSTDASRKAIFAAFCANLVIAIAKFGAFAVTGSASMLAEGIHSVADTGNQGLLFLGGKRATKAPTPQHQFGFGRERYFWAFIVALVLFTLGGMFAIVEGIDKLLNPEHLDSPIVAYTVLGIAIVAEGLSLRTARNEANPIRRGRSWWRFVRTTKNPELPVVLLEDTGALIGLFFALFGITMAEVTGNARWDAVGSIAIGILLGVLAVILAVEMKSLLIGESASPVAERRIRDAILDGPEVQRIIHMRTQHLGPEELLLAAKLEFTATTMPEMATAIDTVEARVRGGSPEATLIFMEPDLYRSEKVRPDDAAPDEERP